MGGEGEGEEVEFVGGGWVLGEVFDLLDDLGRKIGFGRFYCGKIARGMARDIARQIYSIAWPSTSFSTFSIPSSGFISRAALVYKGTLA